MTTTRAALLLLALAVPASAQLDERWIAFEDGNDRVVVDGPVSDADHETDLAWGDLDGNGAADLVVVRKEPFVSVGGRTNLLLLNVAGELVDATDLASAALPVETADGTVADAGFRTPTNDRDVVLCDVDGDGWLDVVTAVDQSPGQPKHVSHPRVYRNAGRWEQDGAEGPLGLVFEDERFPELLHLDSGAPILPHLTCVAAGDVDRDGYVDLYFGDYDVTVVPGTDRPRMETPEEDGDDRLMRNDGKGGFVDASASVDRAILASRFCNSVALVDIDDDGKLDLVKQTSYQKPAVCYVAFNDAEEPGTFRERQTLYEGRPYFVSPGDLNGDGRLDVVLSENGLDRHVYNLPGEEEGEVRWSDPKPFDLLFGEDDKYAGNSLIVDLDGDGWKDVIVTDMDPELPSTDRRAHLYHNRGGTPGGDDVVLREEREKAADDGWVGAFGLTAADLGATHDAAVLDLDGDGKLDLVLSRVSGLDVWLQVEP
jgi:hypothetical protein